MVGSATLNMDSTLDRQIHCNKKSFASSSRECLTVDLNWCSEKIKINF